MFVDVHCFLIVNYLTAYPAVYGQFPQAIPQPLAAVAPSQREGKHYDIVCLLCMFMCHIVFVINYTNYIHN